MKNFFYSIAAKCQQFMSGRYGYDELFQPAIWASLILVLLGAILKWEILSILGLSLWFWAIFRSMSRNFERRQRERQSWLALTKRICDWWYWKKQAWILRDTYRFYRCKQCGKMLRVPKGKGKIKITCPQCHEQIIRKT